VAARPNMRFVPIKCVENQGFLMFHRARGLLVRQRTMTACAIRAHFAEFGSLSGKAGNGGWSGGLVGGRGTEATGP
jgi:hypothetical protein